MKRKSFQIFLLSLVLIAGIFFIENVIGVIRHLNSHKQYTIILDAGHGGFDPGKVGVNQAKEKEINLQIAYKLKNLLEQNDIKVIMTREDDTALCKNTDRDMKRTDLKNRVKIINTSDAVFALSIHQNSFTQESSWGAQVFYYRNSEEGRVLAEVLQDRIKKTMNDGNHRLAKANGTYYMLKYSTCPLVIVECGFLSNRSEADLLCQDEYQDRIAWAIHLGVMEYINNYCKCNQAPLAKN